MVDSNKKIRIYDDTGSGDSFDVKDILFEDDTLIIATVVNEWYSEPLKVMIEKESRVVLHSELRFYYAENN